MQPERRFTLPGIIRFLTLQGFLLAGFYALISLLGATSLLQSREETVQALTGLGLIAVGIALIAGQIFQKKRFGLFDARLESLDDMQAQLAESLTGLARRVAAQERRNAALPEAPAHHPAPLAASVAASGNITPFRPHAVRPAAPPEPIDDAPLVSDTLLENLYDLKHLDIVIQPVMRLPQRKPVMLEILARLKTDEGLMLPAQSFLDFARKKGGTERLDRVALQACLDMMVLRKGKGHELPYMLNVTPETLRDTVYMNKLLAFIQARKHLAPRLIFEMRQNDYETLTAPTRHILLALSRLGCRFSMDHVINPQLNRGFLTENRISFVKLSAARLAAMGEHEGGQQAVHRIRQALARDGVTMIAEQISDDATLISILELGLDYGQGYRFGQPVNPAVRSPQRAA